MPEKTGVLATIIAGVLFGTSVPLIKLGLASLPPEIFATTRFAIAVAVILALPARRQWIQTDLLTSRPMWAIIIINTAGYVLQFQGQRYATSSNAALIISTAALMVPVIVRAYQAERLTLKKIAGVVIGFIGTALVITHGAMLSIAQSEFIGDFMILGTAVTIALIFVLSKPLTLVHGGRPVAGSIILLTFVLLLPTVPLDIGLRVQLTWQVLFYVFFLGILATVGAYYFFTKGLETVSPVISSIILPIEVIVAVILSVIIFGDPFNFFSGTGAVLILAGVFLVSTSSEKTNVPTDVHHSSDNC